ncbi:MAG: tRNA (adenosine(37)-N6)-threonylcarbamoyltransferase complex dimerization subunit type 1 TsaB [Bacteroidetes bacterium]|nr:tRNA (adenosine(37)-N6)-threonylcarbamoyltransferase complex dimerization subunit type 1 TsaB [Bacteroidota bacterium]MBS1540426.1 tRNA (adenosine(37)-N6)-threonylcarbamoyltransferase complex dimerization subunit type 1 TsaB [Bacteroidota bacterium]
MALILSLETSSHTFSCALHQDGRLVSFKESPAQQSTASLLSVSINQLFEESEADKKKLSAVVISSGPGSYTGLRIGTATAKGICYALNVPLITVNTLELLLYQFMKSKKDNLNDSFFLCPMLDARRSEVYCALFDSRGNRVEETTAKIIDENSFSDYLTQHPIFFFGDGASKCKDIIRHPHATFTEGINPSAAILGELGDEKLRQGNVESVEDFEPLYLKDFLVKKPKSVS